MSTELRLRLAAFAALSTFVSLGWVGIVADPPLLRTALATAVIVAALALCLRVVRSRPLGGAARVAAVGTASLLATGLGLLIAGLPARLLLPGGWAELAGGIDAGLAAIGASDGYPYAGPSEWARLVIIVAAPLIVGLAGWLTFSRPGEAREPRLAGLAVLVGAYAMAVTIYGPDAAVLRGLLLLLGVAAWLWLPGLRPRALLPATALLAAAAVVAIPLTSRPEAHEPLVDYTEWTWATPGGSSFNWDHSYGPIDWERTEDVVLSIRSSEPNYWKASVLDRFDGRAWARSELGRAPVELPAEVELGEPHSPRPDWYTRVAVTVGELESDLVVGPGSARSVTSGIEADPSADQATIEAEETLREGDRYLIRAYAPDPSAEEMAAAGWAIPPTLVPFTELELPSGAPGAGGSVAMLGTRPGDASEAQRRIAASPYGRVAELTERLTGGAASPYGAVKAVETYLRDDYRYSETPPDRSLPLRAFLLEDRIGYCQQFSGAMALMLRIAGIPTRVATGFSAGVANREEQVYTVRALDAHSWVEVYFAGIGWVPFDPTPPAAPAETRAGGEDVASAGSSGLNGLLAGGLGALERAGIEPPSDGGAQDRTGEGNGAGVAEDSGASALPFLVFGALVALGMALVGLPAAYRLRRDRRLAPPLANEARIAELATALELFPRRPHSAATLLELEALLRSGREPRCGRYLEKLRLARYAPADTVPVPSRRERGALRRRLTADGGWRARLAGYRLIPPLSPRRPHRRERGA